MAENPFARASLAGAVDLSALKARAEAPQSANAPAAAPGASIQIAVTSLVIDGGVENLRELLELSNQIPVLVDFKTAAVPGSAHLSSTLERLVPALGGKLILCRIDADAQPQILEAFQMRQGGVAVALVKGQPVPLVSADLHEAEIIARLDRLLEVAAQQGMNAIAVVSEGGVGSGATSANATGAAQPAQLPPRHQKAFELIDAGDYDGAIAEYEAALREMPTDTLATAGLAQTRLLKRVHGLDFATVIGREVNPEVGTDQDATLTKADALVASGQGQLAFDLMLARFAVQISERDALRTRLLEYFTVLGNVDASVIAARKRLTALLY